MDRATLASREEIRAAMRQIARANCNTVHVNVWSRRYPPWRSQIFERSVGGQRRSSEAGLAVAPRFEYGFVGGWRGDLPGRGGRGPIFDAHPEWLARTRSDADALPIAVGGGNFYWMVHTRPDVQGFLITMVHEVAAGYHVPATEFEPARYPSTRLRL